jgi:hypothetical protein
MFAESNRAVKSAEWKNHELTCDFRIDDLQLVSLPQTCLPAGRFRRSHRYAEFFTRLAWNYADNAKEMIANL